MRALTLYQPWATLVAIEAKWIETRSWATSYRGPLAIHAGKTTAALHAPIWEACAERVARGERSVYPPGFVNGAVIATCTLADCVPIIATSSPLEPRSFIQAVEDHLWLGELCDAELAQGSLPAYAMRQVHDQRPYGDFTPGRFAWLLSDIELLLEPVPARGAQGLWEWAA